MQLFFVFFSLPSLGLTHRSGFGARMVVNLGAAAGSCAGIEHAARARWQRAAPR
jgi:hypothetical protein